MPIGAQILRPNDGTDIDSEQRSVFVQESVRQLSSTDDPGTDDRTGDWDKIDPPGGDEEPETPHEVVMAEIFEMLKAPIDQA